MSVSELKIAFLHTSPEPSDPNQVDLRMLEISDLESDICWRPYHGRRIIQEDSSIEIKSHIVICLVFLPSRVSSVGHRVEYSFAHFITEFDVVLGVRHMNHPNFRNRCGRVETFSGDSLQQNESSVFKDKILSLGNGDHELLADEFVEFQW